MSGLSMVDKEMHAVEKVDLADTRICIQEEQIYLGIQFFDTFVYALGNDVIGDTAKGLQTKHVIYAILHKSGECQLLKFLLGDRIAGFWAVHRFAVL